ncbi:MAG: tetratricopeptide repeat protein [Deltaproteobacteria bacterium]|nr:tetratricopeptide repeat protein [Deltaproteobacteria bacterium]MBW2395161.1 tetratricopeptide repeat protein [Deltaproteobacteria bacterium]
MAKRPDSKQATETLEEIESLFDRLADWVSANPRIVMGVLAGILGLAGVIGLSQSLSLRSEQKGSEDLSAIYADYLSAMGATPGALEVEEPANPEIGKRTRTEYAAKLLASADDHGGTRAAVGARIQAGVLQAENGELEAALASWREAADAAPSSSSLHGLALLRLASGLEQNDDFPGAAAAYAEAGDNPKFPARFLALASAARCWLEAGDEDQALVLYGKLEAADPPAGSVPEHVQTRLEELKMRSGEGAS